MFKSKKNVKQLGKKDSKELELLKNIQQELISQKNTDTTSGSNNHDFGELETRVLRLEKIWKELQSLYIRYNDRKQPTKTTNHGKLVAGDIVDIDFFGNNK